MTVTDETKLNLEIGHVYQVVKPAFSFGEIDGVMVDFPEERFEIEILPKPQTVNVYDGETEVCEPLPEHLAQSDWYNVRNIHTGKRHWLNSGGYHFTQL